jgi:hypothetical protein
MNAILMVGLAVGLLVIGVLAGHTLKTLLYDIHDRRLARNSDELRRLEARRIKIGGPGREG